jgi:hypothetical protein
MNDACSVGGQDVSLVLNDTPLRDFCHYET